MATSKKPAAEKAAPAKTTKPRTRVKKVVETVDNYTEPVQNDVRKVFEWKKWAIITLGAFIVLGGGFFGIRDGCRKKGIDKNNEKVKELQQKLIETERAQDSIQYKFNELENEVEEAIEIADKATSYRQETQREGATIRDNQKKITHEITKKILDPNTSDSERDAIAQQLIRARQAVKDGAYDTLRQPASVSRRRY